MNKYYKGFTDSIKKYQKSDSYKAYRRNYEARYRDSHRIETNFTSWRSVQIKLGKVMTLEKETDYLLKRILSEQRRAI